MISYNVEKANDYYVLYKNIEKGKGSCSGAIFKGKRKECYKKLKEVNNDTKGKDIKSNVKK